MKAIVLATVALLAPTPPFPPPKLTGQTPEMKCDWGSVGELDAERAQLQVRTDAGPLTLAIGPGVKVAGPDGKPIGSVRDLRAGQSVRVYYVVDNGAKAREIDLL